MIEKRTNEQTPEHKQIATVELEEVNLERREKLREMYEAQEKKSPENQSAERETARHEALERAQERQEITKHEHTPPPAERRRGPISKKDRDASFNAAMNDIRSEMSAPSRVFSKVIHNKVVEKTSEVVGGTIARPNAILSGAIFAFLLTLGVYIVAKNLGYPLSGFETIAAFAAGWIIGIAYDFIKIMVTGRK